MFRARNRVSTTINTPMRVAGSMRKGFLGVFGDGLKRLGRRGGGEEPGLVCPRLGGRIWLKPFSSQTDSGYSAYNIQYWVTNAWAEQERGSLVTRSNYFRTRKDATHSPNHVSERVLWGMSCQKPPHSHGQKLKFFIHFSSFLYTSLTRKLHLSFSQLWFMLFSALIYLYCFDDGLFEHRSGACIHPSNLYKVSKGVCRVPK